MGILGLTSFLNNSILDEVLLDVELKNCLLLIDGYSFLHKIHSVYKINSTYGGNYDELATSLDEVFNIFKECKIVPIFLLDGARDEQEKKLKTTLNRANQRIHDASILNACVDEKKKFKVNLETLIDSGTYRIFNNLLPIMAFKIFFNSLLKFEFIHFQCPFEADYELVCLANLMEAPLLSCDSDFYVYNLKHGYISLNDLDFEIKTSENETEKFLAAKLYKVDKFLECHNKHSEKENILQKEMLPIFSVICGNDYVDKSAFESLWKTFDASNNNLKTRKKLKRVAQTKSKDFTYKKLLKWLGQFRNTNECLTMILNFVKIEKHEMIERVVRESIQDYMCLKPSSAVFYKKLIAKKLNKSVSSSDLIEDLIESPVVKNYEESQITNQFMNMYRDCQVSRYCLDVLIHRKIILNCQIEVSEWPNSYVSSTRIRKLLYMILVKIYGMNSNATTTTTTAEQNVLVKEFLRYQKQIKTFEVDLGDLNKLNLSMLIDAEQIYKNLFDFDENLTRNISLKFSEISPRIKNFYSTLFYWLNSIVKDECNEFESTKNENCLRAFLVSFIKNSLVDKCFLKLRNSTRASFSQETETLRQYELSYEKDSIFSKYFSAKEEEENSNEFLGSLINYLTKNESNYEYLTEIRQKLNSFSTSIVINNNLNGSKINRLLNLKLVHCLSEFQSICFSLNYIEEVFQLLDINFFKLLSMQMFFNGTFLHNFIEELEQRSNPDLYIEELLGRRSFFKCLYVELLKTFKSTFDISKLTRDNVVLSKSQKKKLKKKQIEQQKEKMILDLDVEMSVP